MTIFFQLIAAYLFAEFLLLPWLWQDRAIRLATYGLIHLLTMAAFVNTNLTGPGCILLACLAACQILVRGLERRVLSRAGESWKSFFVEQLLRLSLITLAALALAPIDQSTHLLHRAADLLQSVNFYLAIAAYIGVVFGGGVMVQKVSKPFFDSIEENIKNEKPGLPGAGKYIGWAERSLLFLFVIIGFDDAIGFLLALKALARYPEISQDTKGHFGDYFLVGTLTSFGIALLGGLVYKWLIGT